MALPKFSTLSKRQQLAIALGAPLAIALILGVVIYQKLGILGPDPKIFPSVQRNSDPESLYARINALQAEIDQQDIIIKKKPVCERELKDLESEIDLANDMLPQEREVLGIVQKLSEMGRQIPPEIGVVSVGSVSIRDNGATPATRGANTNELPQVSYDIDIEGNTNGLIKYIDSIERFPHRYMAVTNIAWKPGKYTVDKDAQHHVKLTLVTYTFQPKKARGK